MPLLVPGLAGCSPDDDGAGPVVLSARLVEHAAAPLARTLEVRTDVPTRLELWVDAGDRAFTVRFPGYLTAHEAPVLGVPPGREVWVTARVTDLEGRVAESDPAAYTTPALPAGFPDIEVLTLEPDAVDPGVRLIPIEVPGGDTWLVALEAATGEVAWLYDGEVDWGDVRMTRQGTLVGLDGGAVEMDLLGRVLTRWTPSPRESTDVLLPWAGLHHELYPMFDGSFVSLAHARYSAPAYPTSYADPAPAGPAALWDTRVVGFDRGGAALWEWSIAERLDTARIGFDSLDLVAEAYDWCHGNAVVPYDDAGTLLVELRHLDALVALDPGGEVRWILGDPSGWSSPSAERLLEPAPGLRWPYHPHGPSIDREGRIVLFDNGTWGRTPYDPPRLGEVTSRVVAFEVDEARGRVRQAWEWEPPDGPLVSDALGNAQWLPVTGNVLAAFAYLEGEGGVTNLELGRGRLSVRVIELVPGRGEPVSDLRLSTPLETGPEGVKAYRAVAAGGLYGDGVGLGGGWEGHR